MPEKFATLTPEPPVAASSGVRGGRAAAVRRGRVPRVRAWRARPALSRTAYLLTGDAHLAEDLVQTALFKAAKSWHRIQGDPEPYVRRILYTQNISWWRSRRHVREHQLGAYDEAAPHPDADLRLSLEQALARLTTRQRTVLVLRYFEDLTEAQTASHARHRRRDGQVDQPPGPGPAAHTRARTRRARGRPLMTLHDELQRIADRAPVADVPDDTWARARGARRATSR